MTGITLSYLVTEEVGDSGSWLHDPDNWDTTDFDDGLEYAQFKVRRHNIPRDNPFNITVMPGASGFAFPTEERTTRVTFSAIFANLAETEKLIEFWVKHTNFGDSPVYLVILDSKNGSNVYKTFWDDNRVARKYLKGKLLKVDEPFEARRNEYIVNGQFQGVWSLT